MLMSYLLGPRPILNFQLGFWLAMATMVTMIDALAAPGIINPLRLFLNILVGLVFTQIVIIIYSFYENRTTRFRIPAFITLLLLAALCWGSTLAFMFAQNFSAENEFYKRALRGFVSALWPLSLWAGLFFLVKLSIKRREEQLTLNRVLLEHKKAQLSTLRYQLNPHFLFNMLNSIDVSILSNNNDVAHKMIQQLSNFLRNSLQQGEQDKITLQQELTIIQDFIAISRHRFSDALEVNINIDADCMRAMLPPMLLQPLVENAIKYGWSQTQKGMIEIQAAKTADSLILHINNSKQNGQQEIGTGTGLSNTTERLRLIYGEEASVSIDNSNDTFAVEVQLPWEVMR